MRSYCKTGLHTCTPSRQYRYTGVCEVAYKHEVHDVFKSWYHIHFTMVDVKIYGILFVRVALSTCIVQLNDPFPTEVEHIAYDERDCLGKISTWFQ